MNLPKRVFLIDDDEEESYILRKALDQCCDGVELVYEKNSQNVKNQFNDENFIVPEILFIDWQMPVITGKELLSQLRGLPRFDQVPIVIFTGSSDPQHFYEAIKMGASYFLYKPFNVGDLSFKLEKLFSFNWRKFESKGIII